MNPLAGSNSPGKYRKRTRDSEKYERRRESKQEIITTSQNIQNGVVDKLTDLSKAELSTEETIDEGDGANFYKGATHSGIYLIGWLTGFVQIERGISKILFFEQIQLCKKNSYADAHRAR